MHSHLFAEAPAKSKGFTLIELLVVIGVIAILAGTILVNLGPVRQRGRDSRRISEVKQVQAALESYYNSSVGNQKYPNPGGTGLTRWCNLQTELRVAAPGTVLPLDPTASGSCDGGNPSSVRDLSYDYAASSDQQGYIMRTRLEDDKNNELQRDVDGVVNGIDCTDPIYCLRQP